MHAIIESSSARFSGCSRLLIIPVIPGILFSYLDAQNGIRTAPGFRSEIGAHARNPTLHLLIGDSHASIKLHRQREDHIYQPRPISVTWNGHIDSGMRSDLAQYLSYVVMLVANQIEKNFPLIRTVAQLQSILRYSSPSPSKDTSADRFANGGTSTRLKLLVV